LLHTADWHIGQRLHENTRDEEQSLFFNWLLEQIQTHQPHALVVAGDVFDTAYPANSAYKLYYNFLSQAHQICPHIIIVAGNHDSPFTLNAPSQLLSSFNISVVGNFNSQQPQNTIIPVKNHQGNVVGVVGAMPYIRMSDLPAPTSSNEDYAARIERIKTGIEQYYTQMAALLQPYHEQGIPVVCTGHLFAAGDSIEAPSAEHDIYIGNEGKVGSHVFPDIAQYIALGHIHKPQMVAQNANIRYSGSPIPLDFTEHADPKQVVLVKIEGQNPPSITPLLVPTNRPLLRFKGNETQIQQGISQAPANQSSLTAWAEVILETPHGLVSGNLLEEIKQDLKNKNIELFALKIIRMQPIAENDLTPDETENQTSSYLNERSHHDIFNLQLSRLTGSEEDKTQLTQTYLELLNWMEEEEAGK
nr:exonuclease subunit SbcD [Chitinophagales bacterium]